MKTVKVKLSDVKPYWRNPRNNEKAVEAVIASIDQYGYLNPIVVDKDMVIIAGHTRHKAMQKMGREEVDVIIAEGLTPEQATGYRIIDNKTSELATWNVENLIPELRALPHMNVFESFFPDLKFEHQDVSFNPVTDADVEASAEGHDTKFKDIVKGREEEIRTYTCPHCGGEFDAQA